MRTQFPHPTNHRTLTYGYDPDGNRQTAAMPNTSSLIYTYTGRDQLKIINNVNTGSNMVTYAYDASGNVATRTLNNGTSTSYGVRDPLNRATTITHTFVGASRTLNYAYDAMGNRKYVQRSNDTLGDDGYGYDLNNQITSFRQNGALSGGVVTGGTLSTLNMDASGNRTSVVVTGGTTTTYAAANNLNQYPTIGGAGATYDFDGNLASYNGWSYTYDAMNRLTIATGAGTTANFYYDGLNRQVGRSITGTSTRMSVWDGWNLYAEFAPASATPADQLVYGAGGELVLSPLLSHYYYPDALGSTSHLANASGTLLECYTYDLSGTPTFYDPNGVVRPSGTAYGISHLFTGQRWYPQIGLYDNRNRFLKTDLGRFLQPDPIGLSGDPANLYRYCGNNPANRSDPYGLWTFQLGLSLTVQLGPLTLNYSRGIAFDGHGNIGVYNTGLVGGGAGAGVAGGLSFNGSNADQIGDLNKDFTNVSAGGAAGAGASVDAFEGRGSHNQIVVGGGATIGVGLEGG